MALSIRRRLLLRLILAIVVCWLIAIGFVYVAAYEEVEEVFDAALAQQARVLATLTIHESEEEVEVRETLQQLVSEVGPDLINRSPLFSKILKERMGPRNKNDYLTLIDRERFPGHRYESKIGFIISDSEGGVLLRSNMPDTVEEFHTGFGERRIEDELWRIYGLVEPASQLRVQVGEDQSVRRETVVYIVYNSLWPLLVALPLIALVIGFTVRSGLKPLQRVAVKVERRDPNSLVPIAAEDVPDEVVSMVESLNRLFSRVQTALDNERQFTADAAHELRTPLAALKAMAQAKQLDRSNGHHDGFLQQIIKGVDRTSHLLDQLLTLARMESQSMTMTHLQQVDLATQLLEALSDMGQLAIDREIDLAYLGEESGVMVKGYGPALQILVRNLIDNAMRYTPKGGSVRIDIESHERKKRLVIEDSGPGIPQDQMSQLFQRFKRGKDMQEEGSGLGLSIVQRIIELHKGRIELENIAPDRGLRVSVWLESVD